MSPLLLCPQSESGGFPRVSGDEPYVTTITANVATFSPREWG